MADVISGSFANFKLIPSRKVCQLVIEVPGEHAEHAIKLLGLPQGGTEIPVAVARLAALPKAEAKPDRPPRKPFKDLPRSSQAAIMCNDELFRGWLGLRSQRLLPTDEAAAVVVREHCGVTSRKDLDSDERSAKRWDRMLARYRDEINPPPENW